MYFDTDRKSLRLHGSVSGPVPLYAAVTLEPQNAKSAKIIFQQSDYDQTLLNCRLVDAFIQSCAEASVVRETLTQSTSLQACLDDFFKVCYIFLF